MNWRFPLAVCTLLPSFFLSLPAVAETTSTTRAETLVITGTRTERMLADTPVRTEVISSAEIQRTHARSLKEALENVPGLQLREIHGKSGYEATLQGMTSDQLLILIDGMPLAASTGSSVDLSQYSMADVDRIEIVKGAASAQYGSSAMGGVINIITRSTRSGARASVTYDAGSYGKQNISEQSSDIAQHHVNAVLEGGNQQWQGRLTADVRDTKGFDANPDTWVRQGDDSKRVQYAGQLSWKPDTYKYFALNLQRFEESDIQWLPIDIPGRLPNKYEEITRDRLTLSSRWTWSNGISFNAKGLIERYNSDSWKKNLGYTASFDKRNMQLDTDFLSLQLDLPMIADHQLQAGLDLRNEELSQFKDGVSEIGTTGSADRQNYEFFLQDNYFFSDQGEVIVGLRAQEDSDFGFYASPKVAFKYDLYDQGESKLLLRASIGTGYRVPNLKERYYTFDHSSLGYMVVGNLDLEPESSISYQAGTWFQLNRDHTFDINVFYNDIKDLIQTDEENHTVINGISVYSYRNVSNARTYGVETVYTGQLTDRLRLNLSHTYTRAENTDTDQPLTRRPEHLARAGFDWQLMPDWDLSLRWRYQSRELSSSTTDTWSPAWNTFDIKTTYQATQQLSIFGGVDNLTNEQRDFSTGTDFGPIAGRFMYVGLQVKTELF